MKSILHRLLCTLAGAVSERYCPLCRTVLANSAVFLCPECLSRLEAEAAIPCGDCGLPAAGCTCPDSSLSPLPVFLNGRSRLVHTWYFHAGEDRLTEALLLACKRKYDPALSVYIADTMAAELEPLLPASARRDWILTWAPRSLAGFGKQGFDQCEEIVRRMGRTLHIPVRKMLVRVGGEEQKRMENAAQRAGNIAGAFAPLRVPAGCRVLLFDDIITTGATMREAGRVLAEAGAAAVFPLAFAKTMHTGKKESK